LIPASEVGFGGNVTFSSGALNIENSGSARLTIENGPDGDRLSLFARNFRGFVEEGIVEFNFGFSGTNALFAGDLPLDQSLLALEDTLLNLDSSQLNQDLIGSITTFVGSRSFQSNTLDITSISVSALSVPEPGHLGVFALILLLVRNARVRSCSARVG